MLYDGVCGLCSRTVRWLIAHDRDGALRFAPLQGSTTAALRATYPGIPQNLDSVVLIDGGRMHLRSKVFLYGARHLTRPWCWAYTFGGCRAGCSISATVRLRRYATGCGASSNNAKSRRAPTNVAYCRNRPYRCKPIFAVQVKPWPCATLRNAVDCGHERSHDANAPFGFVNSPPCRAASR